MGFKDRIISSFDWITDVNWKTWLGHGFLGLLIFFIVALIGLLTSGVNWTVCATAATAYFLGRETRDLEPYIADRIKYGTPIPPKKVIDGFFDFWTPTFLVHALALILGGL